MSFGVEMSTVSAPPGAAGVVAVVALGLPRFEPEVLTPVGTAEGAAATGLLLFLRPTSASVTSIVKKTAQTRPRYPIVRNKTTSGWRRGRVTTEDFSEGIGVVCGQEARIGAIIVFKRCVRVVGVLESVAGTSQRGLAGGATRDG